MVLGLPKWPAQKVVKKWSGNFLGLPKWPAQKVVKKWYKNGLSKIWGQKRNDGRLWKTMKRWCSVSRFPFPECWQLHSIQFPTRQFPVSHFPLGFLSKLFAELNNCVNYWIIIDTIIASSFWVILSLNNCVNYWVIIFIFFSIIDTIIVQFCLFILGRNNYVNNCLIIYLFLQ